MSNIIDEALDVVEEVVDTWKVGLSWWAKIFKISQEVEDVIKKEVYTEKTLYKGNDDNVGDINVPSKSSVVPSPSFVDMELDSSGTYHVPPKILEEK
jgi:hypothetical protein